MFLSCQLSVYQTLLAKLDETGAAGFLLTREDWYRQLDSSDIRS